MSKSKERIQCFSVRLSNAAREAMLLLSGDNPPLALPEWDSRAVAPRSQWFEIAVGYFLASTLRGRIADEQIDFCTNATEQCRLWVTFVKAERGQEGYSFNGDDPKTRRVVPPKKAVVDNLWE